MDQDLDFESYSQTVVKLIVSEHCISRIAQRGSGLFNAL